MAERSVTLKVNGHVHAVQAAADMPLLYLLRNWLGLKGTRFGCGANQCGACHVLLDGHSVPSCDTPLWAAEGKAVTTVEGLATDGALSALQQAFLDEQADQRHGAAARAAASGRSPRACGTRPASVSLWQPQPHRARRAARRRTAGAGLTPPS